MKVVDVLSVGRDPRAMVFDSIRKRLFVASLISSNAHPQGQVQETLVDPLTQKDIAVIDTSSFTISGWVHEVGTIIRGLLYDESTQRLIAAVSHANNQDAKILMLNKIPVINSGE